MPYAFARSHRAFGHDRQTGTGGDQVADEPDTFHFHRHPERQMLGRRGDLDLVTQRVADRRKDECVLGQGRERHRLGPIEVERRGQEPDNRFVAQVLDHQPRVVHRFGDDRERELTLGDLERKAFRRTFGEPQRHAGRDACDLRHERRYEPRAHRADDAERRVPDLEALQHRHVTAERLELAADRPRPRQHPHAEFRGHCAPAVPHEQLHSERGFELANVLRDVGLHRVQPIRRGGERAFFGHREERLELTDVDRRPLRRWMRLPAPRTRTYRNDRFMLSPSRL